MGHAVSLQDAMGATQSIHVAADGRLHGASDPRRPSGLAAGH
jgi:gamma-glutamyltranspeptidase